MRCTRHLYIPTQLSSNGLFPVAILIFSKESHVSKHFYFQDIQKNLLYWASVLFLTIDNIHQVSLEVGQGTLPKWNAEVCTMGRIKLTIEWNNFT